MGRITGIPKYRITIALNAEKMAIEFMHRGIGREDAMQMGAEQAIAKYIEQKQRRSKLEKTGLNSGKVLNDFERIEAAKIHTSYENLREEGKPGGWTGRTRQRRIRR